MPVQGKPDPAEAGADAQASRYAAYLLRIWPEVSRTRDAAGVEIVRIAWRATLEEARTRRVTGFDSIDALCAFLHALAASEVE